MRKAGVVSTDVKGEDNEFYHDIISLFKIYRSVNWKMQIKINQVKQCFHTEYGTDVDEFLDSVYQAGMDINLDMEDMRERIESINQANKYLKLIDEAVELMRKYHPQGEKYYWVLYYTYMSAYRAENTDEILDKLEPHFPRIPRTVSYTHLDVYKRQYWLLTEKGTYGEAYNIAGDYTCTVGEMLDELLSMTEIKPQIVVDPKLLRKSDVTLQVPDTTKFKACLLYTSLLWR